MGRKCWFQTGPFIVGPLTHTFLFTSRLLAFVVAEPLSVKIEPGLGVQILPGSRKDNLDVSY